MKTRLPIFAMFEDLLNDYEPIVILRTQHTDISVLKRMIPITRAIGAGIKFLILPTVSPRAECINEDTEIEQRISSLTQGAPIEVFRALTDPNEILVVIRPATLDRTLCTYMNHARFTLGKGVKLLVIPQVIEGVADVEAETDNLFFGTDLTQRPVFVWRMTPQLYGLLMLLKAELDDGVARTFLAEIKIGDGGYGWSVLHERFLSHHASRVVSAGLPLTDDAFMAVYNGISYGFDLVGSETPMGSLEANFALHSLLGVIRV